MTQLFKRLFQQPYDASDKSQMDKVQNINEGKKQLEKNAMTDRKNDDLLNKVKEHRWFYEFSLPDGTKTKSYLQDTVKQIHETREKVLRQYLMESSFPKKSALDIACHEGFYSLILRDYFTEVVGIDKNTDSIELARLMSQVQKKHITYLNDKLEDMSENVKSDFVLCYGLLYHIDNPMKILRKISSLARHSLCIESQVLPFSISASVEDGFYTNQRDIKGLFGLCRDYPSSKEGGTTEYALVPSLNALTYLLQEFGFSSVRVYEPHKEDYEQFVRKHRVIIFAERK